MRPWIRPCALAACTLAAALSSAAAQPGAASVEQLLQQPASRAALDAARAAEPATIADQIRLCEIPAPPFKEAARAEAFAGALRAAGLRNVRIDTAGNVLGERPGLAPRPHLVIAAHLDTVFPEGTDVSVRRDGATLRGPGIGDNCRGLAVALAVVRALAAGGVTTPGSITIVGTVGEEGLGDLRGVKALFDDTLAGRVDRFIAIDGDGHTITHVAVGSHRYRVTFRGAGGHSYSDFGAANPIHALGRAIDRIADLEVPAEPRTTFSVGRVGGGTSINAIASEAWLELDLRSSDPAALDALDASVRQRIRQALDAENSRSTPRGGLSVSIEKVGERPAGRTAEGSTLVQTAVAATRALGLPVHLDEGSTDANVPIRLGIPAIMVGAGGRGTGAHTVDEAFDTTDSWRGTQRIVLLALALTH